MSKQKLDHINIKKLLLVDSLGALLSAFMLGIILAHFHDLFGMPPKVLYPLSFIAILFALHSFYCYFRAAKTWKISLKIIALANLMYGCITAVLVIYLYQQLTALGIAYFGTELLIIIGLAIVELKTSARFSETK